MERFPEGLVSKAHRLLYLSILGSRVIKKKKEEDELLGAVLRLVDRIDNPRCPLPTIEENVML